MSENIKDRFYTVGMIKAIWDQKGWNDKGWSDSDMIARKFKEILDDLGLEEITGWYKSETDEKDSGKYIFSASETPRKMKELFDIYHGNHKLVLESDIRRIANILMEMLPVYKDKVIQRNRRKNQPDSDVFPKGFMADPERKDQVLSGFHGSMEKKGKIEELLRKHMAQRVNPELFEKRLFVKVEKKWIAKETERREIYKYQYRWILSWNIKWKTIMDDAGAARKAEQFEIENGTYLEQDQLPDEEESPDKSEMCEDETSLGINENAVMIRADVFCQALLDIYKESAGERNIDDLDISDVKKDGKKNGVEAWYDRCSKLVGEVLTHHLKKASEDDFHYLILQAFQELEDIHDLVLRRRYEWYYCISYGGEREDVQKLSCIRKKIDDTPRNMLDYLY